MEDTITQNWKTIELEDVNEEGYFIIPARGDPNQYAMKGPSSLFPTYEEAEKVYQMMIAKGVAGIGDVKVAKARLEHHRKLDLLVEEDARPRLVVVSS